MGGLGGAAIGAFLMTSMIAGILLFSIANLFYYCSKSLNFVAIFFSIY